VNGADQIAYLDGSSLKLATRATTEEQPLVSSDLLDFASNTNGVIGLCFCVATDCLASIVASEITEEEYTTAADLDTALMELFSATSCGERYVDLYAQHVLEMYELMITFPALLCDSYRTLHEF
jgi:hypothetical protein